MSKQRFSTDKEIQHLKPISGQARTEFSHKNEKGFICKVSATSKAWVVTYFIQANGNSKRRRVTIGKYPDISLADALDQCRKIKSEAKLEDNDIVGTRADRKAAPTVAKVMDHYFTETKMAPKTIYESRRLSNKEIVPELGDTIAIELARQDVKDLHKKIADRGAVIVANRTVELLRRAFNCAFEEEFIAGNPFPSLKKIKTKETARERILKDSEIKIIWNSLDSETDNMRDVIRLLLLLGQRSGETMSMAVEDIDADRQEWTVPASKTKNGKPNVIPLPETAWNIIKPRLAGDTWIFPSKYNTTRKGARGDGHTKSTKDTRRRLKKSTGINGWTSHDCRRTCRTIMAREGILPFVAEMVLGHIQSGIVAVYDQHTYAAEKLKALEKVDKAIRKILGIVSTENKIIPIRKTV